MSRKIVPSKVIESAGLAANLVAGRHVFEEYKSRRSPQTLRRQKADLELLVQFLKEFNAAPEGDLQSDPESWRGATWGLFEAFRRWQLDQGYAITSINVRLSTVKKYAGLAFKAGVISAADYAQIRIVSGYSHQESLYVDEKRQAEGLATRKGAKKAEPVNLTPDVIKALKRSHPDSPQGRRDALLMCLLLDHGLRCGEIARLRVSDFHIKEGQLIFYRPKVDKVQTHALSHDTFRALVAYRDSGDCPESSQLLLRSSNKSGRLTKPGMSERAITRRVNELGLLHEIENLSAHDGRHSWATRAARGGTDPFTLREAGGWNSLDMARRYIEDSKIANEGVKLD